VTLGDGADESVTVLVVLVDAPSLPVHPTESVAPATARNDLLETVMAYGTR
jgi:hypothetical protein